MYVTPEQFDRQIRWLKRRGFRFLTFADLGRDNRDGDDPPEAGVGVQRVPQHGASSAYSASPVSAPVAEPARFTVSFVIHGVPAMWAVERPQ